MLDREKVRLVGSLREADIKPDVIASGKVVKQTDIELEGMNYLVEGVIGKV